MLYDLNNAVIMAKTIRSPDVAASNWKSRTSGASSFYASQVQGAQWKTFAGSDQAEKNYSEAVTKAAAEKRRQKAIANVSDEQWKMGVKEKGESRFSSGVSTAEPKMKGIMDKLIPAIQSVRNTLPAAGVRGSAANIQRATKFMEEMAKKRGTFR